MKHLKALSGVLILVGIGYILWQVVPPIFNNYQFEDVIEQEARIGSYSNKSEEDIQEIVFTKAKDLNIPVTREQIKVERSGNFVAISVAYKVHVNLSVYPFDLNFSPSSKNKGM